MTANSNFGGCSLCENQETSRIIHDDGYRVNCAVLFFYFFNVMQRTDRGKELTFSIQLVTFILLAFHIF